MITYAASTFTLAIEWKERGSGLERRLANEQNNYSRRVTGAYKSTPIAMLEENIRRIGVTSSTPNKRHASRSGLYRKKLDPGKARGK